jgi:HipA-like protein
MSDQAFRLLLHGEEAGFAVARTDGSWRWWLNEDWLDKPEPPVLSLHLQNRSLRGTRSESRTPWFLSNLLPEPESALRRRLARTHGVPEADDAALLAILGADMSGALRALPTDDKPPAPPFRASVERAPLAGYRASLGGMQLKFSANFKDHVTLPAHGETGQ